MLGSADKARTLVEGLRQDAAATPFEFGELQEGAKKLIAFGESATTVRDSLKRIGDISSGIGAPIAELADIYGKARVQGRLFAEDINQLTGRGIPIIGELAKQFGVAESEVRGLVESGKVNFSNLEQAFASLTGEGGKFFNLMAKQSESLPGVVSTAFDAVKSAGGALGQELVKAFNLKDVIKSFGEGISNLVQSFQSLDPAVKKVILVVGAIAAAAGPVLVAFGAIAAAIPALTAGLGLAGAAFAALTGPIGLTIAAVTAAVAAFALFSSASGSLNSGATDAFKKQQSAVEGLTGKLNPLIGRYEELKGKSKLTAAEQEELNGIIGEIGKTVPQAISGFDKYGKALGINTEKAREFVKQQQAILAVKNKEAIDEQVKNLQKLDKEIALVQGRIKGGFKMEMSTNFGGADRMAKLTAEEIAKLNGQLADLNNQKLGTSGLINELKGIKTAAAEAAQGIADTAPPVKGLLQSLNEELQKQQDILKGATNEQAVQAANVRIETIQDEISRLQELGVAQSEQRKVLQDIAKDLTANTEQYNALGDSYDYIGERAKILEDGIKKLTEAGFSAQSAAVQRLVKELAALGQAQKDAFTGAGTDKKIGFEVLGQNASGEDVFGDLLAYDGLEVKAKATLEVDDQALRDFTANAPSMMQATREQLAPVLLNIGEDVRNSAGSFDDLGNKVRSFAEEAAPVVQGALVDLSVTLVESFGQAVVAGADVFSQLPGAILGTVAGLASQLGKIAIGVGIGIESISAALKSLQGPVAIAAGVALLALGGAAKAAIGALGKKSGGGVSMGSVPKLAVGTNFFPSDGLAYLHQGEAVVPKKFNPALHGMNGAQMTVAPEVTIGFDKISIGVKRYDNRVGLSR
jgi:tape measure domain-containing protein